MSSTRPKPPGSLAMLQRWVQEQAKALDEPVLRVQRQVSFMVIAGALERAKDGDGKPLFAAKGGVAMELRLGVKKARATQDFDATFRAAQEDLLDRLDEALREPYLDFTFTRLEPTIANEELGFIQVRVKIDYRGRSWQSVTLELMPEEGRSARELDDVPAFPLDFVGIEGPERIACIPLRYQLAQKAHACTEEMPNGKPNDRSRDVIDIILIRAMLDTDALPAVRKACIETFEVRDMHAWPPRVTIQDHWPEQFAREATALGFEPDDVAEAVDRVHAIFDEIDAAG
ncbi:MAG TPA: nucleotidyl transferase AbiEii/AbiGii toxin family protein [Gaiellaceae bacterium]|jgi:hypothetical protein|nr:nucleotidyl transferase AbiEii/AbiGii toxin family protein [Gaiellaceae bacterium]